MSVGHSCSQHHVALPIQVVGSGELAFLVMVAG